ncbi:hypothetical protein [Embleya sp. NPDC005971]|uniref:hypothetical protein n=1 Tax=Embleya sp. NPDC005971 TaxID=3156724 RepID=UPI0033F268EE
MTMVQVRIMGSDAERVQVVARELLELVRHSQTLRHGDAETLSRRGTGARVYVDIAPADGDTAGPGDDVVIDAEVVTAPVPRRRPRARRALPPGA